MNSKTKRITIKPFNLLKIQTEIMLFALFRSKKKNKSMKSKRSI